jgi:4-amino-4-deoxy-L-arabinose transferase-like glycosyltransferase
MTSRTRAWILAAILAACVVGRGAYVLHLVHSDAIVTTTGDAPSYLAPARSLVDHARFDSTNADRPEFLRTPGYPLFVAAIYRVFGERNTAVLLVQVLLSAVTVFLVYLLAARMWSPNVGLVAALFTAVEPLQSATTATLLTETLAAFLLVVVAAIGYVVFTADRPRWWQWAGLGLALTAATFVRPVTYYLPLFVVALLVARCVRRRNWHGITTATAAFLVPIVVLCGAWMVRNHDQAGSWRFSGVEGKNMYIYRAAGIVARDSNISLSEAEKQLRAELGPIGTERQGPYYDRMFRKGLSIVVHHPLAAAADGVQGLGSELFGVRAKFFDYLDLRPPDWLALAALALLLAFYAACGYGIAVVLRARRNVAAHVFVIGIVLYNLLASAGPEAFGGRGERFRAPIMPILILYAAFGVYTIAARRLSRNKSVAA